jgi:hypothetical protein
MLAEREQLKQFIRNVTGLLKEAETEVHIMRSVLNGIKSNCAIDVDHMIAVARKLPEIGIAMNNKYDPILQIMLANIDQAGPDQDLSQYLRDWKPTGRTN